MILTEADACMQPNDPTLLQEAVLDPDTHSTAEDPHLIPYTHA